MKPIARMATSAATCSSAGHDDGLAVIMVEGAANGLDPAVGHHRKEFRRGDRYRAVDSVLDALFGYHVAFLQLQLHLEHAFEPAPVRPDERFGDRMGDARHRAEVPAAEHFFLGADIENALEVDQAADEVGNPPDRFAIDQRHFAGAGIDGIDRDVGGGFRAAEHDDLLSLDDGGIGVLRRMQDRAAGRLEGVFAGVADRLAFIELAGADGDEVKFLAA